MVEGYPNRRGKIGRKRKWKDMLIARVKLNPEQAVLTCCDSSARAIVGWLNQCAPGWCPATGATLAIT